MRLALYLFRKTAAWLCWLITLSYASLLTFTVFMVIIYWKKLSRFCYLLVMGHNTICLGLEENEWNWKWKNSDFEPEFFDWGQTKVKTLMILFYSGLYFLASPSVMLPPWYSLSPLFLWDMQEAEADPLWTSGHRTCDSSLSLDFYSLFFTLFCTIFLILCCTADCLGWAFSGIGVLGLFFNL